MKRVIQTCKEGAVTIDTKRILWGMKTNDLVTVGGEDFIQSIVLGPVADAQEEKMWFSFDSGFFFASKSPKDIILYKAEELQFEKGNIVGLKLFNNTPGKIIALHRENKFTPYLVEFENLNTYYNAEELFAEPWFPGKLNGFIPNKKWCNEKELQLLATGNTINRIGLIGYGLPK